MEDMMAASPVTFSGRFAPDKFCISIKDNSSSNASAVMKYRSIFFNIGLMLDATNDAEVAAVLGHELAHITLGHHTELHTFPKLTADDKFKRETLRDRHAQADKKFWQVFNFEALQVHELEILGNSMSKDDYLKKFKSVLTPGHPSCLTNCNEVITLYSDVINLQDEIKLISLKYYSKEDVANKAERDADEVGFEFYAKAQWPASEYTRYDIKDLGDDANRCLQSSKNLEERGTESHPETCWRVHNQKDEIFNHESDYAPYQRSPRNGLNKGPSLLEVKNELKALTKQQEMLREEEILNSIPSLDP